MSTKKYVTCCQCGRIDRPRVYQNAGRPTFHREVGTATVLQCPDCGHPNVTNGLATQFAQRCRACCPTGHRTRECA